MPLVVTLTGTVNTNLNVGMAMSAGETVATQITLSSGGSPINLSGYSLKMQINFASPLELNTTNGGITIISASSGIVQINIADTVSEQFVTGNYPYDFWMISGGGIASRLLGGVFSVLQSISPIP